MTRDSGIVVVSIIGELDTANTREIEPAFSAALPDRRVRAVVDLSGVPFLTSAALAMFVVQAQAMRRAGGDLRLAALQPRVADIFERAGFSVIFPIYPTLGEAIAELEGRKQ